MKRSEELQAMILKAERSVRSARLLASDGSFDFAASRAYYAAFYAMEAALLVHDIRAATHAGIISAFSKQFLKTEILPKELSRTIGNLFRERQTADYEYLEIITASQAETDCQDAEIIITHVRQYLESNGFLNDKE